MNPKGSSGRGKRTRRSQTKTKKPTFSNVRISQAELDALRPLDPISPLDVVKYIRLPEEDNTRGRLDLTLTPYIRDPIQSLGDYDIENLFCIGPTQSGKTVVAQVAVAYTMDQDPGPILYTYPDENTAEKALQRKIVGMILKTPELKKLLRLKRPITKKAIEMIGMSIDIAWSNSPATMNVMAKKRVIGDEVRLFSLMLGQESNAIKLMQDRLTTYLDIGAAQALFISSPSTEGDLLHQQLDVPGTLVYRWHVPCPKCGKYQLLKFFENVKKPKKRGERARCVCNECKAEFPDKDRKKSWNNKGVYAPEGATIGKDGKYKLDPELIGSKRVVYWWDSLVSPFRSFTRIWEEFDKTRDKLHDYKNFIQCWLAEFWKEQITKTSVEELKTKKADYPKSHVPDGVQVLTAGMDTQDDSLYVVVKGFGIDSQEWLIYEQRIMCDILTTSVDDLQALVYHGVSNMVFTDSKGGRWKVVLGAWDSGGHRTQQVYAVTKRIANIVPIKGNNKLNRSVVYSKAETHYNIRTIEYLEETEFISNSDKFHLPSNVSNEYLVQFASKKKESRINRRTGAPVTEWITRGEDHFRDADAYGHACLDIPIRNIGTLRARLKDPNFKFMGTGGPMNQLPKGPGQKARTQKDDEFLDPWEASRRLRAGRNRYNEYQY